MITMDPLKARLRIFLIVFITVMILGVIGFMAAENLSLADAFYFTIVTVATVGYGDIHPGTQAGKILAILLIIMGVGTFLGVIANATEIMLNRREKRSRLEKLNMVIGVFFSEVGTRLLTIFSGHDPNLNRIRQDLVVTGDWTDREFSAVSERLRRYEYRVEAGRVDLAGLRDLLAAKREFLVSLLANPVMMEHESFTGLLWAIFHLGDELAHRDDLAGLPDSDRAHLGGDINRGYNLLVGHWLDYMAYLKRQYPYLFSLAMRTNPFDQEASPVVR